MMAICNTIPIINPINTTNPYLGGHSSPEIVLQSFDLKTSGLKCNNKYIATPATIIGIYGRIASPIFCKVSIFCGVV